MHLSPEFGLTYKAIEKDGFSISKRVEMLLSSDTATAIAKSMGVCMVSMADALTELKPDILVLLGDRFETMASATVATVLRIPIAHIHGGEVTEGAIDDPFRHSVTKMAYWHFTSSEQHAKRVQQLGEAKDRVFNVGALGVDNIKSLKRLEKSALEKEIGFTFGARNFMVTFHPVTQESATAEKQLKELLLALDEIKDAKLIFTRPNADTEGRVLIPMIEAYVAKNQHRAKAFVSLGTLNYHSTLQFVDGVIGNSSSGLIEAPYFRIGTVDIGDRQKGRTRPESVIHCEPSKASILEAILKLAEPEFKNRLRTFPMPFGDGGAAVAITKNLLECTIPKDLKKAFQDL